MTSTSKSPKAGMISQPFARMAVVVALFLVCLHQTTAPTLARPPVKTGGIAFAQQTFIGGLKTNIYVLDPDTRQIRQLTNTDKDSGPDWSPDGKQLVFASGRNRGGTNASGQIYVMNADGKNPRALSDGTADRQPDWSPDGKQIAFMRKYNIFIMNADGSNPRQLTHQGLNLHPAFSPDGAQIAFVSTRANPQRGVHLFVMNTDGTNVVQLTPNPIPRGKPSWSPDGRFIAFTGGFSPQSDIFVLRIADRHQKHLTNDRAGAGSPTWSPDGKQIAFTSKRAGWGIYAIKTDGGGVVKLADQPVRNDGVIINPLAWYVPGNLSVTPHQKWLATWGWLKSLSPQ